MPSALYRSNHPRLRNTARFAVAPGLGITMTMALGACATGDLAGIRSNPTPALQGIANTDYVYKNDDAITHDHNMRMIHDDLREVFYWGKASRLTEVPVPR